MVNLTNYLCRASRRSPREDGARKLAAFADHHGYWPPTTSALYFGTPNAWPSDWRWDWNPRQHHQAAPPTQSVPPEEPLLLQPPLGAKFADYERIEIPWNPQRPHDGAYEVRWRRRATPRATPPAVPPAPPPAPHHHPAPPHSPRHAQPAQPGTQGHASPAAHAAAAAALAASAALLDDTIPADAREYLRLGAQLLKESTGADPPAMRTPPPAVPPAPEPAPAPAAAPVRSPQQPRSPPLTPPAPAHYDGGVHTFLSQFGGLIFDMASPLYTVPFRASWTPHRIPLAFANFPEAAVEPRVRKLIIISRQFPWHIEVSVEHEAPDRYVLVSDVLRRLREEARTTVSQSEYELMLHIDGGRERLHRAFDRRMRQFPDDRRVLRRVDFLGEETILGGLRIDRNHEVLNELVRRPFPPGTEDTLHLVANFVTLEHVRAVLNANNFA